MVLVGRKLGVALALTAAMSCAAAAAAPAPARPRPAATPRKLDTLEPAIAIAVNGEELSRNPAPKIVNGRVLVPVVRIFTALGIGIARDGDTVTASAPGRRIVLRDGSGQALIDGRPVQLGEPARRIDGATYVPLRFVADALGAQVTFNAKADRVEVVSLLVGRTQGLEQHGGGGTQIVGNVSAVDSLSNPPSLTVERGADVRTIAFAANPRVELQDVVARTSAAGTPEDIHVGDAVSVIVGGDGRASSAIVRYASRSGTIAAVTGSAFVLDTGFFVIPDKATSFTLNADPASIGDLKVGDRVVVRLNPDTNEKRQVIALREVAAAPDASPGPVGITDFSASGRETMRVGDALEIALHGTPGGRATFDIGPYLTRLPLSETSPGVYTGRYVVPANVNVVRTVIYAHLTANGAAAPRAVTKNTFAIVNTPPQIVEIAPAGGRTVNSSRPAIFATYRSPVDGGINAGSVSITVNGADVSSYATRTDQFVTYNPGNALPDGPVNVVVRVWDRAGNSQQRSWSFVVRSH